MGEQKRVERWMVARLDKESDYLLLEISQATKRGEVELTAMVDSDELQPQTEDLDWWGDQTEYRKITRQKLLSLFGFDEGTELVERMVFYVFLSDDAKPDKVVDATVLARALSKEMYNRLLNIPSENAGGAR